MLGLVSICAGPALREGELGNSLGPQLEGAPPKILQEQEPGYAYKGLPAL